MADSQYYQQFVAAMNDDFNTRVALAGMYDLVKAINTAATENTERAKTLVAQLKAMANVLGILQADPVSFLQGENTDGLSADDIEALIAARVQAKKISNMQEQMRFDKN